MLALARALMPNPWIILLDEPSEGVQPSIVHEIGKILSRLKAEAKLAIVIVEQNLDLVLDVATRIAVLERGRIARQFGPEESRRGQRSGRCTRAGVGAHDAWIAGAGPADAGSPAAIAARGAHEPASQQSSAVVPSVRPLPSAARPNRRRRPLHRPESQPRGSAGEQRYL